MARLVCPYCFEGFPAGELAFRCINTRSAGCLEEDQLLARYQNLSVPPRLGKVFTPQGWRWSTRHAAPCSCGTSSTLLVCPRCHNNLPSQFGGYDSIILATIGAKEAGKSHYLAVLIEELTHRVGARFQASLSALDERTIKRYRDEFHGPVYRRRETIATTTSAGMKVSYPMIYKLSLERNGWLGNRLQVASLVFFDTAGEDLDSYDKMSLVTRYIANSQGLLFLLDPLQIAGVRDRVRDSAALPGEHTDPVDIVTRVAQLIREFTGLGPSTRIKVPVALAFTKIDAVRTLFEPGSPVHRASPHQQFFNLDDGEHMNDSIRAHLEDWTGGDGLHRLMTHNFERFHYFGLSSLGNCPDSGGRLGSGVAPFRVEDPLLWILSQLKLIPAQRSRP